MPMTPRPNSLSISARRDFRVLVHLADERPDFTIRELVDAVPEQPFVFGQRGQGAGEQLDVLDGHDENLITRGSEGPSKIGYGQTVQDHGGRRIGADARRRPRRTRSRRQQPPAAQPPPQQQPPPADPPQPPVFRAGINFVRVDVIVTDKNGNPVADLEAGRLRGHRGRQAAEDRDLQADQARRRARRLDEGRRRSEIRTDYDEEAEAARDDVRLFAIFLDDYHVRRGASLAVRDQLARFIETQLGPSDMVGLMYPLETHVVGADDAQPRRGDARHAAVRGPQVRLHAEERVRGAVRELSDRDGRADPQCRCRCRRSSR